MKIAAAMTSTDAASTYTEVNSLISGLQSPQQAIPFHHEPFSTRFRSLINNSSISPTGSVPQSVPGQAPGSEPARRCHSHNSSDLPRVLTGELIGRPVDIATTDNDATIARENYSSLGMEATITGHLIHYEKEEVFFSSSGRVETEDGRSFAFSLDLSMQRTTVETIDISLGAGPLTRFLYDPLVLSFTGGPPTFSTTSFLFDLNCDGREDNIAVPQPGCGFLAFDRNGDGQINDGLELFGPQSGNGFADLSEFDEDSNLWIDENDPIFSSLSVWKPDDQGTGELIGLQEAGVGAISLSHAGTRFTLQGTDNQIIAQVAANGIFLTEDGEVRSLQEIDLALGDTERVEEKGPPSDSPLYSNAINSLRLLIAMQRMRARLLIARNRLERSDQYFADRTETGTRNSFSFTHQPIGTNQVPPKPNVLDTGTMHRLFPPSVALFQPPMGIREGLGTLSQLHSTVFSPLTKLEELNRSIGPVGTYRKK